MLPYRTASLFITLFLRYCQSKQQKNVALKSVQVQRPKLNPVIQDKQVLLADKGYYILLGILWEGFFSNYRILCAFATRL